MGNGGKEEGRPASGDRSSIRGERRETETEEERKSWACCCIDFL